MTTVFPKIFLKLLCRTQYKPSRPEMRGYEDDFRARLSRQHSSLHNQYANRFRVKLGLLSIGTVTTGTSLQHYRWFNCGVLFYGSQTYGTSYKR